MTESTTVRVRMDTRDRLRELADDEGVSVDTLIREALAALRWQRVRLQVRADMERISADPRERELAQLVAADMDEMARNAPWPVVGVDPSEGA